MGWVYWGYPWLPRRIPLDLPLEGTFVRPQEKAELKSARVDFEDSGGRGELVEKASFSTRNIVSLNKNNNFWVETNTSRARASRVAEVSRFEKCTAIGSNNKFCL